LWLVCERKKLFYETRTLAKSVERIKVRKLKYLITSWLHFSNPL
jgi:hypothetical protein